jgi:hypothetical protein
MQRDDMQRDDLVTYAGEARTAFPSRFTWPAAIGPVPPGGRTATAQ